MKSLITLSLFTFYFSITSIPIVIAGGSGGGGSPAVYCSKYIIHNLVGKKGCSFCIPYSPSLPSWEDLKNQQKFSEYRMENFILTFEIVQNDKYFVVSDPNVISKLIEHMTCNTDKGAARHNKSNYVERERQGIITGEYCSKWVIGISKDYIKSIIESDSDSDIKTITPNVDVKIFCAKKSSITSLKYKGNNMVICNNNDKDCNKRTLTSSDINFKSSMIYFDYFICRDGAIHPGNGSCKVVTKYALGCEHIDVESNRCKRYTGCDCSCRGGTAPGDSNDSDYEEGCGKRICKGCICAEYETDSVSVYADRTEYDYGKLDVVKYEVDICQKPIFLDSVKKVNIEKIYDPNLVNQN